MPLNAQGIYYADTSTPMSITDITSAMATSISNKLVSTKVDYTPALVGVTIGNGTIVAQYSRMGDIILDEIVIQLGSTSAVTGDISITGLPIAGDTITAGFPIGSASFEDSGVTMYLASVRTLTATSIGVRPVQVSSTYATLSTSVASNVPFTWGNGDKIHISIQRIAA